jgi:hypothetical protein
MQVGASDSSRWIVKTEGGCGVGRGEGRGAMGLSLLPRSPQTPLFSLVSAHPHPYPSAAPGPVSRPRRRRWPVIGIWLQRELKGGGGDVSSVSQPLYILPTRTHALIAFLQLAVALVAESAVAAAVGCSSDYLRLFNECPTGVLCPNY